MYASAEPKSTTTTRSQTRYIRNFTYHAFFPQFRRLPRELQLEVWQYALPPSRVLRLDSDLPMLSIPAIAHACADSRSVACKTGALWSTRRYHPISGTPSPTITYTWFDPERDVLWFLAVWPQTLLDSKPQGLPPDDQRQLPDLHAVVKHIVIPRRIRTLHPPGGPRSTEPILASFWPSLKTINIFGVTKRDFAEHEFSLLASNQSLLRRVCDVQYPQTYEMVPLPHIPFSDSEESFKQARKQCMKLLVASLGIDLKMAIKNGSVGYLKFFVKESLTRDAALLAHERAVMTAGFLRMKLGPSVTNEDIFESGSRAAGKRWLRRWRLSNPLVREAVSALPEVRHVFFAWLPDLGRRRRAMVKLR